MVTKEEFLAWIEREKERREKEKTERDRKVIASYISERMGKKRKRDLKKGGYL